MAHRLKPLDYALGVSTALVWGSGILFAKAALEAFPPILLMSLRFLVTALVFVWFVPIPRQHLAALFWISIISAAIQYSLTFTGLVGLDASITMLIVQLEVPFMVLIGAVFLRESPGLQKWFGIALAFAGVALIAGEPEVTSAATSVALVIAGAFVWAVGQAMVRRIEGISGLTTMAWVAVMAAPQLFVMSLIFETGQLSAIQHATPMVWFTVAYLGLVMNGAGYAMWYSLVHRNPVSQVAPFLLLLPVFGVAGGYVFLGETHGPLALVGGVIVMTGLAIIMLEKDRKTGMAPSSTNQ